MHRVPASLLALAYRGRVPSSAVGRAVVGLQAAPRRVNTALVRFAHIPPEAPRQRTTSPLDRDEASLANVFRSSTSPAPAAPAPPLRPAERSTDVASDDPLVRAERAASTFMRVVEGAERLHTVVQGLALVSVLALVGFAVWRGQSWLWAAREAVDEKVAAVHARIDNAKARLDATKEAVADSAAAARGRAADSAEAAAATVRGAAGGAAERALAAAAAAREAASAGADRAAEAAQAAAEAAAAARRQVADAAALPEGAQARAAEAAEAAAAMREAAQARASSAAASIRGRWQQARGKAASEPLAAAAVAADEPPSAEGSGAAAAAPVATPGAS